MIGLNFLLRFNCDDSLEEMQHWIREELGEPIIKWKPLANQGSVVGTETIIDFSKSEFYDPNRIDEPDGWLYYRYLFEVIFLPGGFSDDPAQIKQQVNLVNFLTQKLKQKGCRVAFVGEPEFESLLRQVSSHTDNTDSRR